MKNKKAARKSALMRWTNAGLFIATVVVILTGVLISVELFSVSNFNPRIVQIHVYGAYVMAALVIVHMLLHLRYLSVMGKKIVKAIKEPVTIAVLCSSVFIALAIGIAYFGIASVLAAPVSAAYEPTPPPVTETTTAAENTDANAESTEIATTTATTTLAITQNRNQNVTTTGAATTETTTTTQLVEATTTTERGRERGRER